ncbi:MAG TPA: hypothetical protein ENN79_03730 [Desulfobacteraceae bacterium]|nr:hypothetical protein [Desulfobacteraceae bacterium]
MLRFKASRLRVPTFFSTHKPFLAPIRCSLHHALKGQTVFIRLLALEEKATGLTKAITSLSNKQTSDSMAFVVDPESFHQVPSAPFCYWVSNSMKALWKRQPLLTESDCRVNHGMATKQDFRFLRFWTEVSPELVGQERRWVLYAKGGTYSPYYSDVHLLVDWVRDGRAIHEYLCDQYPYLHGNTDWVLHPECDYFSSGLTYSRRTQKGFNARVLPRGCRFDKNGPTITCSLTGANLFTLLGLINSKAFRSLLELTVAFGSYEIGLLEQMPIPTALWVGKGKICYKTRECVRILQKLDTANEVSHAFQMPALCKVDGSQIRDRLQVWETEVVEAQARMVQCQAELDDIIYSLYAISIEDRQALEQSLGNIGVEELIASEEANDDSDNTNQTRGTIDHRHVVSDIVSYGVGIAIGRWDIRFAMGKYHLPELPDPFDPLPVCPPGMLQGPDGLPAKPDDVPSNYPIRIDWDGILVDDPKHQDDIVRRVRDVLEVIWKEGAEAIEREACEILSVRELRDYFRKPGNGGFWVDHIKRYSKSRRKAPIYWYLRSAKGNYGLWLYYHRLDKDILFKALLNYVEPKIRLEEDRLKTLRGRKEAAGSSGREAKQIEKDMDRQEQFVSELRDFADKLRRAANLHLETDLNDGVVLNIAPLRELVPWKEAEKYWEELMEGKYEWSSVGKQLPEKGLVK